MRAATGRRGRVLVTRLCLLPPTWILSPLCSFTGAAAGSILRPRALMHDCHVGCWVSKLLSFPDAVSLFDQQGQRWSMRGDSITTVDASQTCSWFTRKNAQNATARKMKSDNVLLRFISHSQICSHWLNDCDADVSCTCNDRCACQQDLGVM
jgi:hypothetical protein